MGKRRRGTAWEDRADRADRSQGAPRTGREATLTTGLFSGLEAQIMGCSVQGCSETWIWSVEEQVRGWGRPTPERRCTNHRVEALGLRDREIACRVGPCPRTWQWTALQQLEATSDAEGEAANELQPPSRLCEPCHRKLNSLTPQRTRCKVHGCTKTVLISADLQLKAWVMQMVGGSGEGQTLPRRMCDTCREFCRTHPDREVPCGQPGCAKTWTYKTGAQLQDSIAGRSRQPVRPCVECSRNLAESSGVPARNDPEQVMPCVVIGCAGTWIYRLGTRLEPVDEGTFPPSRMCADCRQSAG